LEKWVDGIERKIKSKYIVGVCGLLWIIWNVRNEFRFHISIASPIFQVIPLA
jgi:hypothetical protein